MVVVGWLCCGGFLWFCFGVVFVVCCLWCGVFFWGVGCWWFGGVVFWVVFWCVFCVGVCCGFLFCVGGGVVLCFFVVFCVCVVVCLCFFCFLGCLCFWLGFCVCCFVFCRSDAARVVFTELRFLFVFLLFVFLLVLLFFLFVFVFLFVVLKSDVTHDECSLDLGLTISAVAALVVGWVWLGCWFSFFLSCFVWFFFFWVGVVFLLVLCFLLLLF